MYVLAIDIGGTQYRLAIVNQEGKIVAHQRAETLREEGAHWLVPRLIRELKELLSNNPYAPIAVGIGFGGPVSFNEQRILASLHAPGWENMDLRALLTEQLGLPCVIDNDANAGALGEFTYGAGGQYRNMLYYTVSTGVGGGIILDGELFRGVHGQAGELGHLPIQLDGPPCSCGFRGCVESLGSGIAIAQQGIRMAMTAKTPTLLQERYQSTGTLTAKDVFECAARGDLVSQQIIDQVKQAFVAGLVGAINFFDPEAVVVGGGVGRAPGFLDGLARKVNDSLVIPGRRQVLIVRSTLSDDSVLLGAAALAWKLISEENHRH